ncbi:helix-turn-helix domain-containing protein [Streptococcus pneumoniae]|uniref:XRE family transcriptional regulator n=1 Tax=Streptococcus pneumoniae TaxID=1313 RepID=UPI0010E61E63|nr:S24 family peptidase [Streptococcus pneumoniae]MDG7065008.1 helix-turn-helix domain-containing protein [Streptococcus pneumoniae]MDG7114348.1 helix-turn-helix domain-containing protein [Streptococcus pneumoniae]MDG7452126.1 helix-turn-helix domain-containing protein [Streptococcus pneumoniae]MDG7742134.1 helix-turn-helix domain-containing protein [Streptococcus pneumoniae]MDG7990769.1 helix-turn-helix domain-containing protein [Streptococcus pneumoniae]
MNILGSSIKEVRKSKKLTQKKLAELTGFKQNTISNHENGNRQLDEKDIRIYAQALEVSPQYLFDLAKPSSIEIIPTTSPIQTIYDELKPPRQAKVLNYAKRQLDEQENEEETKINEVSENIIRLDDYRQTTYRRVTGVVSAGSGSIQDDDLDMEVSFYEDEIPDDYDAIAYVVGNSMEPKIKNGDYLFIKNTQQVDYNTIGIFQVDGANYVKKLRQGYLESLNPDYEDIHLDESNDIRTIGEVVSVYRDK